MRHRVEDLDDLAVAPHESCRVPGALLEFVAEALAACEVPVPGRRPLHSDVVAGEAGEGEGGRRSQEAGAQQGQLLRAWRHGEDCGELAGGKVARLDYGDIADSWGTGTGREEA